MSTFNVNQEFSKTRPRVSDNFGRLNTQIFTFDGSSFIKHWSDPKGGAPDTVTVQSIPSVDELYYTDNNPIEVGAKFKVADSTLIQFKLGPKYAIHNGVLYEFTQDIDQIIADYKAVGLELISNVNGRLVFINPKDLVDIRVIQGKAIDHTKELRIGFTVSSSVSGSDSNRAYFDLIPWENVNIKKNHILRSYDGAAVRLLGIDPTGGLPTTGNTTGDAYFITNATTGVKELHIWDGTEWVNVGPLEGPVGPQGPEGPAGATGPAGPQGPEGPAGKDAAFMHVEKVFDYVGGNPQVFLVDDTALVTDVYGNGKRLERNKPDKTADEWWAKSATEIEVLIPLKDKDRITIVASTTKVTSTDGSVPEGTVLYFDTKADFPVTGEIEKLYVDNTKGIIYHWSTALSAYKPEGNTQVQSDWEEVDPASPAYIRRKPDSGELPFITKWNIPTAGYTLNLFIDTTAYHNIIVDWGDGTINKAVSHTYANMGTYEIKIKGRVYKWTTGATHPDKDKLVEIVHWGDIKWQWVNFNGCANLATLPTTSVPDLSEVTDLSAFLKGTAISVIPSDLLSKATSLIHLGSAFSQCLNLTEIPVGLLDNVTNLVSCDTTFWGSTGITTIPANLFKNNTKINNLHAMFFDTSVSSIPAYFFDGLDNLRNIKRIFESTNITTIPDNLFKYNHLIDNFAAAFKGCPITHVPLDFAQEVIIEPYSFRQCFEGCPIDSQVPELWLRFKSADPFNCFTANTIVNWADVPSGWGGPYTGTYPQVPIGRDHFWNPDLNKPVWRRNRTWYDATGTVI